MFKKKLANTQQRVDGIDVDATMQQINASIQECRTRIGDMAAEVNRLRIAMQLTATTLSALELARDMIVDKTAEVVVTEDELLIPGPDKFE